MPKSAPVKAMKDPIPFFHGLQPRWTRFDRLYRVYVSKQSLAGAYIAGQIQDEDTAVIMFQHFTPLLYPWIQRILDRRRERESLYDSIDPFSTRFLELDPRNFRIAREDVVRSRFNRNRSIWTPLNSGVVMIELIDGRVRRFILVGEQATDDVLELMKRFDPAIEIYGRTKPSPRANSNPTRNNRLVYGWFALILFCLALLFTSFALDAPVKKPNFISLAIVNSLAGAYCLARSLRRPDDSTNKDTQ